MSPSSPHSSHNAASTSCNLTVISEQPSSFHISSTPTDCLPPGTLNINIHSIQLDTSLAHCPSPCIHVAIGDLKFNTNIENINSSSLSSATLNSKLPVSKWLCNHPFSLHLNHHLQLFSSIQIDILNANVIIPNSLIGRSEVRISSFCPKPTHLTPIVIKLALPIYTPHHAPTRRPHLHHPGASFASEIGVLELSIQYFPILIEQEEHDNTVSLLLNPEEINGITSAVLETILSALALSRHTRQTLRQIFKLLVVLRQGVEFVSTLEWVLGILLVLEFDEFNVEPPPENKIIVNRSLFASLLHYKQYSIAAYGWMGLVFFGKSNIVGDRKSMSAALPHIHRDDWLVRETTTNNVFQPSYYIVHDRNQNALVICVRGTMSSVDAITDLVCEYARYNDGLVHRGMKVAADWLAATIVPNLPDWVTTRKIKRIVVVGHSLGGGTASLLSMIINDTVMVGLRNLVGTLELSCYSFGAPPVCSKNLSIRYRHIITTVVNEHDIVPRLSYGSVLDLRTCLLAAVGGGGDEDFDSAGHGSAIFKSLSRSSKHRKVDPVLRSHFERISRTRQHLKVTNENPKLYLAGMIYHIRYKHSTPDLTFSPGLEATASSIPLPQSPPIEESLEPPTTTRRAGFLTPNWFKHILTLTKQSTSDRQSTSVPSRMKKPKKLKLHWPSLVHEYVKYNKSLSRSYSSGRNDGTSPENDPNLSDSFSNMLIEAGASSEGSPESPTRGLELIRYAYKSPVLNAEISSPKHEPPPRSPNLRIDTDLLNEISIDSSMETGIHVSPPPLLHVPIHNQPATPTRALSPARVYSPISSGIRSSALGLNAASPPPSPLPHIPASIPNPQGKKHERSSRRETVVVIEQIECDEISELKIRRNMFVQHLPDAYERALSRWLSGDADELGVDG